MDNIISNRYIHEKKLSPKEIEELLNAVLDESRCLYTDGKVASYIPALSAADPRGAGIYIVDVEGNEYCAGDYEKKFSIQSISKVLSLTIALMDNGFDYVFKRVGAEPTGDAFNSIIKLEITRSKPYNPMINAGAIAVTSMIYGKDSNETIDRLLNLAKKLSNNKDITIDEDIYLSEKKTGNRNRALAYYMKDAGIIEGEVEDVLDAYFGQCSILMDCRDIARIAAVYANEGKELRTGEEIIPKDIAKIVKTLMVTCGMYDESGKFAIEAGFPAKSGVGGGIMGVVPHRMGIGTYGPSLNHKGNSIIGLEVLKKLSRELKLSIF